MSDTQQPVEETQAVPAVGFLVVAFNDEHAADQALDAMKQAKKQQQFYFEEAAVIRQDPSGKVHYHETGDMSSGKGAGVGAIVGGVIGLLGGPAGVALGAGAGAALGAAFASGDKGFRNESLNTVGTALRPGTSAVAAITSSEVLKAVRAQVPIEDIRAAVSRLAAELGRRLAEGKDVAIGLLLTPDGIGVKEIAVDENSAEVIGAVITADALVAGAAVITPEGGAYEIAAATAEGVVAEAGVVVVEDAPAPEAAAAEAADAPPAPAAEVKPAPAEGTTAA